MKIRVVWPLAVALLLIGALGVVHGIYSDRWGNSTQLEDSLSKMTAFPREFGDWASTDVEFEPNDMARAGIKGTIFRVYRNAKTRESVSVLLVCGRGGPISVHTPDVCYAGAGYRQIGDLKTVKVDVPEMGSQVWRTTRFAKPGETSTSQLEILWAWSTDGRTWQAPENPRASLARSPALYKLYVVREFVPGSRSESSDTCREFLARSLPDIALQLKQ